MIKHLNLKQLLPFLFLLLLSISCKNELNQEVENASTNGEKSIESIHDAYKFVDIENSTIDFKSLEEHYLSEYDIDLVKEFDKLSQSPELSAWTEAIGGASNLRKLSEEPLVIPDSLIFDIPLSSYGLQYFEQIVQLFPESDTVENAPEDIYDIYAFFEGFKMQVDQDEILEAHEKEILLSMVIGIEANLETSMDLAALELGISSSQARTKGWFKKAWRKVRSVVVSTAVGVGVGLATGGPIGAIAVGAVALVGSSIDTFGYNRCHYAFHCPGGWKQDCSTGKCLKRGQPVFDPNSNSSYQYQIPSKYDCSPGSSCNSIYLDRCSSSRYYRSACSHLPDEVSKIQLAYMKKYGAREFAETAEAVLNKLKSTSGVSVGDIWDIRIIIQDQYLSLKGQYLIAIPKVYAETAKPFIELALANGVTALAAKAINGVIAIRMAVAARNAGNSIKAFEHASKYGIRSIRDLKRWVPTNSGLEKHHLIEQRFATKLGVSPDSMKGIVLTRAEHRIFTLAWRTEIGYNGSSAVIRTATASSSQINAAARRIYKNYPDILRALNL